MFVFRYIVVEIPEQRDYPLAWETDFIVERFVFRQNYSSSSEGAPKRFTALYQNIMIVSIKCWPKSVPYKSEESAGAVIPVP